MKQILFCTLIVVFSFFCGFYIVNAKEIYRENITNVIIRQELRGKYISSFAEKFREYNTDHILFIVETLMSGSNDSKTYNIVSDVDSIDEEVKKIAYVTEILYKKTYDLNYIGVGQKLIWQRLNTEGDVFYTDSNGRNDSLYTNYETAINNLISETFPILDIEDEITINLNEKVTIENDLLNDYQIVSVDGESVSSSLDNNNLNLFGSDVGKTTIVLKRDYNSKNYDMKSFENADEADLISSGNFSLYKTINVNVTGEYLTLIINNESNDALNLSYGVFKNDELVYKFDINNGGIYKTVLPLGEYSIKQLNISDLYEKDTNEYKLNISDNQDNIIEITPKIKPVSDNIKDESSDSKVTLSEEVISNTYNEVSTTEEVLLDTPDTYHSVNYLIFIIFYVIKKIII